MHALSPSVYIKEFLLNNNVLSVVFLTNALAQLSSRASCVFIATVIWRGQTRGSIVRCRCMSTDVKYKIERMLVIVK